MKTIFELKPTNNSKSFYGKAQVIEYDDGVACLKSYDTIVCKINECGKFVKMWDGYSMTTMKHINAFLDAFGINGGGKAWWNALEVGVEY